MKLEYRKLEEEEVQAELSAIPEWSVEEGRLSRTFTFPAYKDGVVFASAVGHLADRLDHHPDLLVTYGEVRVAVNTHAVDGLSPYDFELARRIEAIL